MTASPTAYSKARMRLPIDVFIALCAMLIESLRQTTDDLGRWCGHRVWLIDGTGVSMPDTEALQRTFGQPAGMKRGCGFPTTTNANAAKANPTSPPCDAWPNAGSKSSSACGRIEPTMTNNDTAKIRPTAHRRTPFHQPPVDIHSPEAW